KDHTLAFYCELVDFFYHRGNRAVETHRRLRKNLDCLNNFWTVAAPGRADLLLCCAKNFLSDPRAQTLILVLTLFCLDFLCCLCSSVLKVWLLLLILVWFRFLRVSVSPW